MLHRCGAVLAIETRHESGFRRLPESQQSVRAILCVHVCSRTHALAYLQKNNLLDVEKEVSVASERTAVKRLTEGTELRYGRQHAAVRRLLSLGLLGMADDSTCELARHLIQAASVR